MKLFFSSIAFLFLPYILFGAIDAKDFYRIFASGNLLEVNSCLQNLKSGESSSVLNAYTGAMLMKKAGLLKEPIEKLESFKAGYKLLEAEISIKPDDVEFRFLRLVIQESAPKFLGYNKNLQDDKVNIIQGYRKLNSFLQTQIMQYCSQSKVLTSKDLQ